jgi:hypothetical protein
MGPLLRQRPGASVVQGKSGKQGISRPIAFFRCKPFRKHGQQAIGIMNPGAEDIGNRGKAQLSTQLVQRLGKKSLVEKLVAEPPCQPFQGQRRTGLDPDGQKPCWLHIRLKKGRRQVNADAGDTISFPQQTGREQQRTAYRDRLPGDDLRLHALVIDATNF